MNPASCLFAAGNVIMSNVSNFLWSHDSNQKLTIEEQTLYNHLVEADYILWKRNKRLRYYDIAEHDFDELLQVLALDQYSNVDYSTLKFFRDYPYLMQAYDIRDEYELHNLLKKLYKRTGDKNIKFKRMPSIEFGQADRDPVSLTELGFIQRKGNILAFEGESYRLRKALSGIAPDQNGSEV